MAIIIITSNYVITNGKVYIAGHLHCKSYDNFAYLTQKAKYLYIFNANIIIIIMYIRIK
jgi:hypothetical protein